eukprot:CAMPEP_0176420112 /NCGR_PEP_ID=MMETSP0127-20121128/8424_1 /TAXON_ID=938130 /ORGANISM="Platyophrya macrostoma, Strain WH" /LENGTH=366 /DNA_ID=CAMNT_0017800669 /DNA_START=87 /DNA_END=1187 /DNA_ORIENTATION=+
MQSATNNSPTKASKDENDAPTSYGNQSETTQYSEDPAQVEALLIPHLEKMFEIENVKSSNYLIYRLNSNMEIKVSSLHKERSILEITQDYRIIDSALQKCKNIEYLPESRAIRLKTTIERKTILVKGIPAAKEAEFGQFIEKLCDKDDKTKQCKISYDKKTECASLTFPDENSTIKIFSELMNSKFQENQIDCIIKDSNAYIELLEATKNGRGGMGGPGYYPYQNNFYQKPMFSYPPQYQPMYMMMPPNNFPTNNYYPGYDKGNWGQGGYRGHQGYPYRGGGGKPYYNNRKYERTEGQAGEGAQDEEVGEKGERREYRGERREFRGGDRRGGYRRGGGHYDKKPQRSKEEMEKITSIDPENYPPLS